ncbi:hypothetical protein Poli38472_005045 [Pythium oligandrum]|uniref:Protein kinase domain-containing protein n=1 Tax=Pythium oligandrum TaxID=41045 RepID=A0A8K1CHY2_PYTOL|nr:hypothetical protein Poli38472_005045 [Pythium oligandrum]|eukprot:TMW62427.1 hypothetical protein Poli38472_005045 [Pythium oligandrum]
MTRVLLLTTLLLLTLTTADAGIFGGPDIDGDVYSYDGKNKKFDPADAFSDDDSFNYITLSNWDMDGLDNLSIPHSVRSLTLINCNLSVMPKEIDDLSSLEALNIAYNHLTTIDTGFGTGNKLTSLNVTKNNISSFNPIIPSLQTLDLSQNALGSVPSSIFSSKQLNALYVTGNLFKLQSVSFDEFDFYAGLSEFHADFVQVSGCADGSDLVNLKGARICRLAKGAEPEAPIPVAPSPVDSSSSGAGIIVPEVPASAGGAHTPAGTKITYIAFGVGAVLLAIGAVAGLYMFAMRRNKARHLRALHEETPLFFDSEKRTKYQQELAAGEKLFPSNDPVLVTWRIDYDTVKLVRRIAKGAFGEVWIGRYRGNKVAVKRLLEEHISLEASEDFIREIKLMAWMQHPKIVEFIGVGWTRVVDMMAVTEYMDSGDLRSLLESKRDLKWETSKLRYAQDTIDAIVYLHSLSPVIIHRDLKSRNILVDSKKGAKLGDFGISATKRERDMTVGVGTTRWLAPELARGETQYTEAVDIYAFGVILAELDTHELPFEKEKTGSGERLSDFAILQGVATGKLKVSFSATCPLKLRELGERCAAFDPKDRPAAAEVAYQLRRRDILLGGSDDGVV